MASTSSGRHCETRRKVAGPYRQVWPASVVVVAIPAALFLLGVVHARRPELAPGVHHLSEYARGEYGLLYRLLVILLSISAAALGLAVVDTFPQKRATRTAGLLLWISAGCGGLSAIFLTDGGTPTNTVEGLVHAAAVSTGTLSMLGAVAVLALSVRGLPHGQALFRACIVAAVGGTASALGFAAVLGTSVVGYVQRAGVLLFAGWAFIIACYIVAVGYRGSVLRVTDPL